MPLTCLQCLKKIVIAAVVNSFIWCSSFAQSSDKIPFSEIGSLSLDSGTAWVQRVFDNSISNDVQVVGLGEVSHGGYEPMALKAKMIQYLVENRGYKNILFEFGDLGPSRPVRQYLLNNNIKELSVADSLAKTVVGLPNARIVFSQLFRWLKSYNLAHPTEMVKVAGFDFSYDAASQYFFLYNYIIPFDHIYAQKLLYHWANNQVFDSSKIASVNAWFNANKSKLGKGMDKDEFDELQYHLQNETHSVRLETLRSLSGYDFKTAYYRDSIMADNVTHLTGSQKTIIWAHNGHISTADGDMGKYLRERYKSRYFILLTDFSNEANVYVVDAIEGERIETGNGIVHEQHFTSPRTTIAYNLFKNYGIPGGIFFHQYLPGSKVYNGINIIDAIGGQSLPSSYQGFDVLVIFNNITLLPKPVNNR
jgi:hypothetical protein